MIVKISEIDRPCAPLAPQSVFYSCLVVRRYIRMVMSQTGTLKHQMHVPYFKECKL